MSEELDVEAIEARCAAATPGPWRWGGNTQSPGDIRLQALISMRPTVMDFVRYGMGGAQPRFALDGLMHKASEMPEFEVCRDADSAADPRVYRQDLVGIKHPDAEFIAAARTDIPSLLLEVRRLRSLVSRGDGTEG